MGCCLIFLALSSSLLTSFFQVFWPAMEALLELCLGRLELEADVEVLFTDRIPERPFSLNV